MRRRWAVATVVDLTEIVNTIAVTDLHRLVNGHRLETYGLRVNTSLGTIHHEIWTLPERGELLEMDLYLRAQPTLTAGLSDPLHSVVAMHEVVGEATSRLEVAAVAEPTKMNLTCSDVTAPRH